jgi:hypothetical protein
VLETPKLLSGFAVLGGKRSRRRQSCSGAPGGAFLRPPVPPNARSGERYVGAFPAQRPHGSGEVGRRTRPAHAGEAGTAAWGDAPTKTPGGDEPRARVVLR